MAPRINLERLHDWRTGDDVPVLRVEPVNEELDTPIGVAHLQGGKQTPVQVSHEWTHCVTD
ncbi:MAG: hypothetical protein WA864_29440 [Acetobacteraceae bacterium]